MSHEILYTSAPRLLKPGMTGYGTVVSTRGISSPLADKLESLSGYRWAFEQGDPQARLNPVCHSHVVITVAGQKYHVLSRVADYGADYSGRSNKIAHHVALSESELTPGGPGWVLKSPGFCETRWDEQLKVIDAGRQPTRAVRDSADYSAWKRVTGDAGWAGGLAETVGSTDRRAVHVIFPLGTDTLGLVEESLNLLPHRDRWNVSFSTYYNVLPASVDCHWRFVLDGTPEATNLRRQPHQRIIDLCRPLGPAIGGELVQRARDGWQPAFGPPPHAPVNAPIPPQLTAAVSQPRRTAAVASSNRVDVDVPEPTGLAHSPPMPARYAASASGPRPPVKMGWRLPLWGTLLLCLLIGAAAGGAGFWLGKRSALPELSNDGKETSSSAGRVQMDKRANTSIATPSISRPPSKSPISPAAVESNVSKHKTGALSELPSSSNSHTAAPTQDEVLPTTPDQPIATAPAAASVAQANNSSTTAIPNPAAKMNDFGEPPHSLSSPEKRSPHLELPNYSPGDASPIKETRLEGKWTITSFAPRVFGGSVFLGAGREFEFEASRNDSKAILKGSDGKTPVASFRLKDGELLFQWMPSASIHDAGILRHCAIRLEPNGNLFLLSKPFEVSGDNVLSENPKGKVALLTHEDYELVPPEVFPFVSIGQWRINGSDGKFFLDASRQARAFLPSTEKALEPIIELPITCGATEQQTRAIAQIQVGLRKNSDKAFSSIDYCLEALIPNAEPKLWTANTRDPHSREAGLTLAGLKAMKDEVSKKKEASEAAVAAAKQKMLDANNKYEVTKNENKVTDMIQQEFEGIKAEYETYMKKQSGAIGALNIELERLEEMEKWRRQMDMLTTLLGTNVTFSFDVFYTVRVDGNDVTLTLGTVTTNLPPAKDDQPVVPETSEKGGG